LESAPTTGLRGWGLAFLAPTPFDTPFTEEPPDADPPDDDDTEALPRRVAEDAPEPGASERACG
jgi:hypothetical protein